MYTSSSIALATLLFAGCALPDEGRPPVKGRIQSINEAGTNSVTLDIGTDAGVKLFDDCDILRENVVIGSLHITSLAADHSVAEITSLLPAERLVANDAVVIDITMQLLSKLHADSEFNEPAEFGRRRAVLDAKGAIPRILYSGPPWSAGKPLVDQETGLPVRVVTGCTITRDFLHFVEQYNSTMRTQKRNAQSEKPPTDATTSNRKK